MLLKKNIDVDNVICVDNHNLHSNNERTYKQQNENILTIHKIKQNVNKV